MKPNRASRVRWGSLAAAVLLLDTGCMEPRPAPVVPVVDRDSHSDEQPQTANGLAVAVALPASQWDWIATHLPRHSVTINDAIEFKDPSGVALTVKAGTTVSIAVASDSAEVSFSKPYPTARRLGITLDVKSIQLKPDGTGLARTAIRNWALRWADADATGTFQPAAEKPALSPRRSVWVFTAAWCSPCRTLRAALGQSGMTIGDTDSADVRFVDVNAHPDLWDWYSRRDNRIPQAALFEGDKLIGSPIVSPTVEVIEAHIKRQGGKE